MLEILWNYAMQDMVIHIYSARVVFISRLNKYVFCEYRRIVVFNATFNNISVIPWGSVLLVAEIGISGENH